LTLIAMFLPAFAGLTSDIEMAGNTHAVAEVRPARVVAEKHESELEEPAEVGRYLADGMTFVIVTVRPALARQTPDSPKFDVAGWKDVKAWQDAHRLSLEFSDVATTLTAATAPLLSNGVFDLSKSLLGVS
jgi:hypothetical protein